MKKLIGIIFLMTFVGCSSVQRHLGSGDMPNVDVHTQATVGLTAVKVLDVNPSRGYLFIQNQGTNNCFVVFGGAPVSPVTGVLIAAGQYYEPSADVTDSVYVVCSAASQNIQVVEGHK